MKNSARTGLLVLLCVAVAFAAYAGGAKESDYPKKDVKFVVNAAAGGGTDTVCRKINSIAEKNLKISLYAVNVPGAASASGPFEVMKARPDGYTVGNVNYDSVIAAIYQNLIPGYEMKKLNIFAAITAEPDALMVRTDSPWKTFAEFVDAAKKAPGKIRVGDQGIGSRVFLLAMKIEEKYGVQFNKISYAGGSAPQQEAMLNNEIDAAITSLGDFASSIKAGKVKGLVEFADTKNTTFPGVPLCGEIGAGDLLSSSFITLAVPAGTPESIVVKLEAAYKAAQESKEFREWLTQVGVTPMWIGRDKAAAFIEGVQKQEFALLDKLKKQGLIK